MLNLIEILARRVEFADPVYEFGARRAEAHEHLPAIASLFPDMRFVGCDLEPGPGVDEIEDLHHLTLRDESVGTVLLLDTIEHVREPWRAMAELRRCLKPGGLLVMSSVWYFPIHAYPDDYWRFSASAFRVLLEGLDEIAVVASGHRDMPHTVIGIGSKGKVAPGAREAITACVHEWEANGATSWKERALMLLPPGLMARGYHAFIELQRRRNRWTRRRQTAG